MIRKFIPERLGRAASMAALKASKNSPKYLFAGGVVGVVGATVLACRATLKLEDVLTEHEKMMANVNQAVTFDSYTEADMLHDKRVLFVRTSVSIIKLYGPAIILGSLSIAAITKSHTILTERNAALSAAYAGLDATFGQYRERVKKALGEEKEEEIYRDAQTSKQTINGEKVKVKYGGGEGLYVELYGADTSHNYHVGSDEANIMTLRQRENYLNDRLRMRGYLFLNEALEELGLDASEAGAVVGWLYKPDDPNHNGQSFVSFCCWDDEHRDSINPLMRNTNGEIFLDFNVDGEIYRRLDEVTPLWKLTDKALRRRRGAVS